MFLVSPAKLSLINLVQCNHDHSYNHFVTILYQDELVFFISCQPKLELLQNVQLKSNDNSVRSSARGFVVFLHCKGLQQYFVYNNIKFVTFCGSPPQPGEDDDSHCM